MDLANKLVTGQWKSPFIRRLKAEEQRQRQLCETCAVRQRLAIAAAGGNARLGAQSPLWRWCSSDLLEMVGLELMEVTAACFSETI